MGIRTRLGAVAVTVVVGLTAGCGAEPSAPDGGALEPASVSSPEPSFVRASPEGQYSPDNPPAQPERPATMGEYTEQGALDFVQYWIDTLNHAWYTGDVVELRAISHDQCSNCTRSMESAVELNSNGNRTEGGAMAVSGLEVTGLAPDSHPVKWAIVIGRLTGGAVRAVDSTGRTLIETPSNADVFSARVDWEDGRWHVRNIAFTQHGN